MILKATKKALSAPVDASILAYFRILFGAIMAWEMGRYLALGRVSYLWADPEFHFKYLGFGWVEALGGNGMHIVCWCMMVAAIGMTLGFAYRICSTLFAIGICYLFLVEQAKFMNHFYLMCLLSWVAVFLPAHRWLSLDAWFRPKLRAEVVPAWTLLLLRFQVGVVYFYGGIAKLNPDWLRGNPMRQWLMNRDDLQLLVPFFESKAAPYLFSYGGLLFDLLVVPALLWKPTRMIAFLSAAAFHFANSQLFTIGVFPALALGLTALFFDPSWPRRALELIKIRRIRPNSQTGVQSSPVGNLTLVVIGVYAALQLVLPFRHLLYPGYVSWTEEGHRFAWHMMLRSKQIPAATFFVIDPATNKRWVLDPSVYLNGRQYKKMLGKPDMILQFAQHIGSLMKDQGFHDVEVKAVIYCRLNGRPPALLIDPEVDLVSTPRSLLPASWILPLDPQASRNQSEEMSIDDDDAASSVPLPDYNTIETEP